jgi:ABC-type sugar transport system permease subunit
MNLFHKQVSLEKKIKRKAWVFLAPWLLGLVYFFLIPFVKSVLYSFQNVRIGGTGLEFTFVGLENYRYMLFEDASFFRTITEAVQSLIGSVPSILIFSLFVALILNQKFKGRLFARSIFFLPVIVASGMIIVIIKQDVFAQTGMKADTTIFQTGAVSEILYKLEFNDKLISQFTQAASQVFDLTWKSGVQILLFLSALQSIPPTYYEAAGVEGANAWDAFWKITFPVLSPTCLLVTVYTVIDSFTDFANPVMTQIIGKFDELKYGFATASAMVYFLVIILILAAVVGVVSRRVFYNN